MFLTKKGKAELTKKIEKTLLPKVAVLINQFQEMQDKKVQQILTQALAEPKRKFYDELVVLTEGTDLTENERLYLSQLADSIHLPNILKKFSLGVLASIRQATDKYSVARKDGAILAFDILLSQIQGAKKDDKVNPLTGDAHEKEAEKDLFQK